MTASANGLLPALGGTFARSVPNVFPETSRARIATIASVLPAFATDFFGFEIHLGEQGGSDFLVCVDAGAQAEALALGLRSAPPSADPIWTRLASFCEAWTGKGDDPSAPKQVLDGNWRSLVHNLWLEFDLAGPATSEAVSNPSLFLGTHHLTAGCDPANADAVSAALDRLEGAAPSPVRRQALRRALAALPPSGSLFQIGLMLARSDARVRICVKGLAPEEVVSYLERLGCPVVEGFEAFAVAAAAACQEIRIAFDAAADTVSGRIGLECYPSGAGAEERWQDLRGLLQESALLTAAEAEALTGWIALIHQRLLDPEAVAWLEAHPDRPSPTAEGAIHRWIHHLKRTLDPSGSGTLKAYLAAHPCWFDAPAFANLIRSQIAVARSVGL